MAVLFIENASVLDKMPILGQPPTAAKMVPAH